MRQGLFDIQRDGYIVRCKRVNKTQARKAFNNGDTVWLQSCKLAPNSYAIPAWSTNADRYAGAADNDKWFDQVVGNFEFYNCNWETGYYTSYYVRAQENETRL